MGESLESIKAREKAFHERLRRQGPLPTITEESFLVRQTSPCYENGLYLSDNKRALLDFIKRDGGWENKRVLDYGCGNFAWGTYFALSGAAHVCGFDLAESGIRNAAERAKRMGLSDRVRVSVMDATELTYPDERFDIVVGIAVLHHIAKYPGVFEELRRVMKPGAHAYFVENLCDFPLWKLWWKVKGDVEEGDIPLYRRDLLNWTREFSKVEIIGDTFLSTIKHAVWKPNPRGWRRAVLRSSLRADEWLFSRMPSLRRWGSFCYLMLTR